MPPAFLPAACRNASACSKPTRSVPACLSQVSSDTLRILFYGATCTKSIFAARVCAHVITAAALALRSRSETPRHSKMVQTLLSFQSRYTLLMASIVIRAARASPAPATAPRSIRVVRYKMLFARRCCDVMSAGPQQAVPARSLRWPATLVNPPPDRRENVATHLYLSLFRTTVPHA